jgi:hypothetical protein
MISVLDVHKNTYEPVRIYASRTYKQAVTYTFNYVTKFQKHIRKFFDSDSLRFTNTNALPYLPFQIFPCDYSLCIFTPSSIGRISAWSTCRNIFLLCCGYAPYGIVVVVNGWVKVLEGFVSPN